MFAVIAAILILISSSLVAHDFSSTIDHPIYITIFDKFRAGVVSIITCYSVAGSYQFKEHCHVSRFNDFCCSLVLIHCTNEYTYVPQTDS